MQINWSIVSERRQEYNFSQEVLARKAGVSKSFISRLENDRDNKQKFNFLSTLKVMNVLDLQLEDLVTYVSMRSNMSILDNLDKIREQGNLNLIDKTLNELSIAEWRHSLKYSVYYDWHKALWCIHQEDYITASVHIDKALERLRRIDSMNNIKINIYIAKGYIEQLKGEDGGAFYLRSEALYKENPTIINYRTRIRLVYYIIKGYVIQEEYDKARWTGRMIMKFLNDNQSIYMKKEIENLLKDIDE